MKRISKTSTKNADSELKPLLEEIIIVEDQKNNTHDLKTELKELVGENKELKIMARKFKSLLRELNETKTSIKDIQANKVAS